MYVCVCVCMYVCVCVCVCVYIYDISSLRVNQLLYCVSLKIYNKFAIFVN